MYDGECGVVFVHTFSAKFEFLINRLLPAKPQLLNVHPHGCNLLAKKSTIVNHFVNVLNPFV